MGQIKRGYTHARGTPDTLAAQTYAVKLTPTPEAMAEQDLSKLRSYGYNGNQIGDIAQVTSLFNYINRIALGLGTSICCDPNNAESDFAL